ncbi:unnamed protein product [Moneuplotes crassus]|uniref:Uncharacterized protein n=1 Tax=Euplotes crassus TaxID=5936 RepID=A0AAD1XCJ6_EUPCR|nr:unnamed protein product [Moneuplotes crassus]
MKQSLRNKELWKCKNSSSNQNTRKISQRKKKGSCKRLRPKTARSKGLSATGSAFKYHPTNQHKIINFAFTGEKVMPTVKNQTQRITPKMIDRPQMKATTTQINCSEIESDSNETTESLPHNEQICAPRYDTAKQPDHNLTKPKPARPVTATYRKINNSTKGAVKHELKFSFKFGDQNQNGLAQKDALIEASQEENPIILQSDCINSSEENKQEAGGKIRNIVRSKNRKKLSPHIDTEPLENKNMKRTITKQSLSLKTDNEVSLEVSRIPLKALKKLENTAEKFTEYIPEEKITPTSLEYYRKIRRSQSSKVLPSGQRQKPPLRPIRESKVNTMAKNMPQECKKRTVVKSRLNTARPSLSEMKQAKPISRTSSSRICNLISIHEKERQSKLQCLTKAQYQRLFLDHLTDLESFLAPENHKRWYRRKNPALTSSLIRSQIDMIRNSLGKVTK